MSSEKAHPDTISLAAPLSVWRTGRHGDMGYVVIAGAAADALVAHELARRRTMVVPGRIDLDRESWSHHCREPDSRFRRKREALPPQTIRLLLGQRRGFGTVKVAARIGASRWSTSVFPQKGGGWFLPVKKAICRAEGIDAGDAVEVGLELL